MTFDIVALCRDQPGPGELIAAMRAAGAQLRVNTIEESKLIQLYREDGRLLLSTEGARLVQVPGEAQRLLGVSDAPHPAWWVETHAPGRDPEAEAAARSFTGALIAASGGVSWSTR